MSELWNDVDRAMEPLERLSRIAQLQSDLRHAERMGRKRCGNCFWWNKSQLCPDEKNINGWNYGPHMDDARAASCPKYQQTEHSRELYEERVAAVKAELAEMGL